MSEKVKKKKRPKVRGWAIANDYDEGGQVLRGGYRRIRAGGGWRVIKKRLSR